MSCNLNRSDCQGTVGKDDGVDAGLMIEVVMRVCVRARACLCVCRVCVLRERERERVCVCARACQNT